MASRQRDRLTRGGIAWVCTGFVSFRHTVSERFETRLIGEVRGDLQDLRLRMESSSQALAIIPRDRFREPARRLCQAKVGLTRQSNFSTVALSVPASWKCSASR